MSDQQEAQRDKMLVQAVKPAVLPPALAPQARAELAVAAAAWVEADQHLRRLKDQLADLLQFIDARRGALPDDPEPICGNCRFYQPKHERCIRRHHVDVGLEPWYRGCNGRWFEAKEVSE